MDCDGKCKGRMRDCCSEKEGSHEKPGKGADMHSHENGQGRNAGKPGWVQAAAAGLVLLFVLGILLRGM